MATYSNLKYSTLAPPLGDGVTNQSINGLINGLKGCVPMDPQNTDYSEIMRLVEAGKLTIEDAD